MREDYYADYYEFEQYNWWFVSRRRILTRLIKKYLSRDLNNNQPKKILDAGCGTGINLNMLEQFGEVTGVDRSAEAIRFCQLRQAKNAQQGDITDLPYENNTFDLVTALDVLEHIEADDAAIAEISRVCKPGGFVLITVPVYPWMWGEHDEINQHVRRYQTKQLITLLYENQLDIQHQSHMNTFLFPAAFVWRGYRNIVKLISPPSNELARADNMHHVPWMNKILTIIFSSETPFVVGPGLPFGVSLVVMAKKTIIDDFFKGL